ncbi:MAG: NADH-quinone oxidoreductase subunit L, partial [Acidobacteriota bacterium]|nr:NADH-quinone oxidoreductase subunit L [Acidobacteriota bacterium]
MTSMPPASSPYSYLWLIPILPFAGFLINGTLGRRFPRALVTAVALISTAIPAAIVVWLWTVMKAASAPDLIQIVSAPWIKISGL